ncbi:hypothetical protein CDAR_541441 [Caerostris darwini]|uniref:Secreted protein n=1 Tax=Caerostris darwini TaxID=1538125 RepID=A0AAV4VVX4_9ARAC|nr:hypothetical protein CDAR_541441 [Caerostris darwini]
MTGIRGRFCDFNTNSETVFLSLAVFVCAPSPSPSICCGHALIPGRQVRSFNGGVGGCERDCEMTFPQLRIGFIREDFYPFRSGEIANVSSLMWS